MRHSNTITQESLTLSYLDIKKHVIRKGFAWEVDWQENQCINSLTESEFYRESAWVILSSGMSVRSVTSVFDKVSKSFMNWKDTEAIIQSRDKCLKNALKHFNHKGKIESIVLLIEYVNKIGFETFKKELINNGVEYIQQFKFFGPATSFHLAKNIGMDVVKPDRHLLRLAEALHFESPEDLCKTIADRIDEKLSVIDVVLWRYCVINPNYLLLIQRIKNYA